MLEKTSLAHAISILETQGYVVHKVVKSRTKLRNRWISIGEDLFGCFDLLAVSTSHLPKLVQVTGFASSAPASLRRAKVRAWVQKSFSELPSTLELEVWAWTPKARDASGMRMWRLGVTGWARLDS